MTKRYWGSIALACVLLTMASVASALPKDPTNCTAIVTRAIVCALGTCNVSDYVDDYWCSRTRTDDFNPIDHNPADTNQNRLVDDHRDVLNTSDPCAFEFDANDRLGSNHGGTNTQRPNHTGVDLQANLNDEVATVGHGKIQTIGWQNPNDHTAGCGFRMIIGHPNGDTSVYCHLVAGSQKFAEDTWVRSGTVIGLANSTGNSNGDHLHLIYWKNGQRIEYWDAADTQPSSAELQGNC